MTLVVTHPYVSSITESTSSGGAGGLVGPTEWNQNHSLAGLVSPAQGGTGITSGTGVTYFSSATVIADSGTLTANALIVGGGANGAPATLSSLGTTSTLLHGNASGNPSFGAVNLGSEVAGTLSTGNLTAATTALFGIVKPDNTTITISSGVITSVGGSLSGSAAANQVTFWSSANVITGDGSFTYTGAGTGVTVKLSSSTSTAGISALSIVTSSSSNMASNSSALNITSLWNNSGTTYDAPLFMNVTNTASASGSLLIDVQVGGTSKLTFGITSSTPTLTFGAATNSFPAISASGAALNVVLGDQSAQANLQAAQITALGNALVSTGATLYLNNNSGAKIQFGSAGDPTIWREATEVLSLGNGTNATAFRVYNTTDQTGNTTNPTNYERGVLDWTTTSNVLTIGTQKGGTGSNRSFQFSFGGTLIGNYNVDTTNAWNFYSGSVNMLQIVSSTVSVTNATVFYWATGGSAFGAGDTGLSRAAARVVAIGDSAANANGWLNWAGESRVSANSTTTSTALANVPGLAFLPRANRNYSFEAHLIFTDTAAGGIQCTVNATSTTTTYTLTFDGWVTDTTAVRGYAQGSAFGNVVASSLTTGNLGHVTITGTLMTSATAPSTVTIQFAQNTSNATPTTILIGSYMWTQDMP